MRTAVWLRRDDGVSEPVWLTTDSAASCYGLPVVERRGQALGPAEVDGELVIEDPIAAGRAEAAGYRVAAPTRRGYGWSPR